MRNIYIVIIAIFVSVVLIQACSKLQPAAPAADELLDGPVEGLNYEQSRQFLNGDIAFNDEIFTGTKGLGPILIFFWSVDMRGMPIKGLRRFH